MLGSGSLQYFVDKKIVKFGDFAAVGHFIFILLQTW
jgi:hypothetical protein